MQGGRQALYLLRFPAWPHIQSAYQVIGAPNGGGGGNKY